MADEDHQANASAAADEKNVDLVENDQGNTPTLSKIGYGLTGVWLAFMVVMAIAAWDNMLALEPNEFGDMLAGVFAPLAFLWLVLGFLQQGKELQASVAALKLQGEELRNSVEQQRELVQATREGIARDIEAADNERKERERAAQPNFVATHSGYTTNSEAHYRLKFLNAGAGATSVAVVYKGQEVAKAPVFPEGAEVQFSTMFPDIRKVAPMSGFIEYTDAFGNRRAKGFTFPTIEGGEHPSLVDGTVDDTVYSPPFPWRTDANA
ncbi:MAG: hypothetical protein MK104_03430 [Erythrobacter sp.]|nr:hypothetical protein [Erythrobacter sp.]